MNVKRTCCVLAMFGCLAVSMAPAAAQAPSTPTQPAVGEGTSSVPSSDPTTDVADHGARDPDAAALEPREGAPSAPPRSVPSPSADLPFETVSVSGDWARIGESAGVQASAPRGASRIRSALAYNIGSSASDAPPYSLTGGPVAKPAYVRHSFSGSMGGPLGSRTFFNLTYSGSRSSNPWTTFARVPTERERAGDFSETRAAAGPGAGAIAQIHDPLTGLPFPGNRIPVDRIAPAAAALIGFVPLPNQSGAQNFYRAANPRSESDGMTLSVNKLFLRGEDPTGGPASVSSVAGSASYRRSTATLANTFPSLGGGSRNRTTSGSLSYSYSRGRLSASLSASYNRSNGRTGNQFAFDRDVTGEVSITGVSTDPFDWGLPVLRFVNYTGVSDVVPASRRNETMHVSGSVRWTRGKHALRWGGDARVLRTTERSGGSARGSFTFTGLATAASADGQPVGGTGYDLADLLLGLPSRTLVQFSGTDFSFRQTAWNLFVQDDWRIAGRFTLNIGVRYEYAPPYVEAGGRLANLDAARDFSAVVPVQPGDEGPFSGRFPRGLIAPDRNNVSPRIGAAWALSRRTVLRAGYSLNYDTPPYASFAQRMAQQPPFAVAQTGLTTDDAPLTLANGFPALAPTDVTNTYGIDRRFQAGIAHVGMVELQQQITPTLTIAATMTKVNGRHLRMLRAPSRIAGGVRTPGAQPFLWESSEGRSDLRAGRLSVRKYFRRGSSAEGTYTYTRSRDNDPSLGGGDVPQDDLDLDAEWARSSFEQRHRATARYTFAIPLGRDRRWLHDGGALATLLGDWTWSGQLEAASGRPFTARVLGDYTDVARGPYGSLRADPTGEPVPLADPTVDRFFNTGAFAAPAPGRFGAAPRNTITGPGYVQVNMTVVKALPASAGRGLELRIQASNVFNTPQFTGLDTYVDSPTYGRVTSAGAMRRVLLSLRVNFR